MSNQENLIAILINEIDNVAVACNDFKRHEEINIHGKTVVLLDDIGMAHKIAVTDISKGEDIVKFGVCIGSATANIQAGELVHLHNIKSNYIVMR